LSSKESENIVYIFEILDLNKTIPPQASKTMAASIQRVMEQPCLQQSIILPASARF
jgi:hypothetical protein